MIRFEVPGMPRGKQRVRVTKTGNAYTPKETVLYETWVKQCARTAMNSAEPLTGALSLAITVHMPIPKSWSRKKRREAAQGFLRPMVKPDLTNIIKSIEDGAQGICFLDDKQVVHLSVTKQYSGFPKVVVTIMEVLKS